MGTDRDNPQLEQIIEDTARREIHRAQTCFPALVVGSEGSDGRVTVQPAIRIVNRRGQQFTPKPVTIPVGWPSWGPFVIQGRLGEGDEVVVRCMDKNWNAWLAQGGVVDNTQPGGRQAGYAHAEPRLFSSSKKPGLLDASLVLRIGRKDSLTTVELNADGSIRLAATDVTLSSGAGLSQFLTTLQSAIAGWVPVAMDGGAALKSALAAWLALTPPTGGSPPPP